MKKLILMSISFYQKYLSLDQGFSRFVFPYKKSCIYYPSCSTYTYQAVKSKGVLKGLYAGFKRILRCTPYHKGGYDPVK